MTDLTPQEIKKQAEAAWRGPLLNVANRNIFEEGMHVMHVKAGAPVNPKPSKEVQARIRQCASLGNDRQKKAKLAEAEIVGKDDYDNPLYKFTQKTPASPASPPASPAERQARSRANRAKEGGKAFTLMLGPAEVEALEKIKATLGVDDASATIKDAIISMAWRL